MSEQFELSALVRRAAREMGREVLRVLDATLAEQETPCCVRPIRMSGASGWWDTTATRLVIPSSS